MRIPFYGLRIGILTRVAFLILAAMLLINIVMLKFAERDLISSKLTTGRLLLKALEERLESEAGFGSRGLNELEFNRGLRKDIHQMVRAAEFSGALAVDSEGAEVFSVSYGPAGGNPDRRALLTSREALASGSEAVEFYGSTWAVIWLGSERVSIAHPVQDGGRVVGALTATAFLKPVYNSLRDSEKLILVYIALNTLILVFVGVYLLSRTVVKPIHRLIKMTETIKEDELFPEMVETSGTEIGRLSRSLNVMLKRLEDNKKELEEKISSLREANEELTKAQEEIVRSEKMASVGRLATGIAHEIGNPVGIILGYLDLLKSGELDKEENRDFLERIETEIARVSQIIRQLLDFSRPGEGVEKVVRIHDLIDETVAMLEPQPMMSNVTIKTSFESPSDSVRTDPDRIKQVFLNIVMNAADAMSGEEREDSENILEISTERKDDRLIIRFADTGPGVKEEDIDKIFDPFYTTKEPGKGTGLGLSVCHTIIDSMGGTIRAESSPGTGVTIVINLALAETS